MNGRVHVINIVKSNLFVKANELKPTLKNTNEEACPTQSHIAILEKRSHTSMVDCKSIKII